jgi:hypothetical protein
MKLHNNRFMIRTYRQLPMKTRMGWVGHAWSRKETVGTSEGNRPPVRATRRWKAIKTGSTNGEHGQDSCGSG